MKYPFIILLAFAAQSCMEEPCDRINEVCVTYEVTNAHRCIDPTTGEYEPWNFVIDTDTLYPYNECSKQRLVNEHSDEWIGVRLEWVECSEID